MPVSLKIEIAKILRIFAMALLTVGRVGWIKRALGRLLRFAIRVLIAMNMQDGVKSVLIRIVEIFEESATTPTQEKSAPNTPPTAATVNEVPAQRALVEPALISVAPHNIRLYEYFLRYQLNESTVFLTSDDIYGEGDLEPDRNYMLIRHDIDYAPEKLHLFTNIEEQLGVRSDVHVIVDKSNYEIDPFVDNLKDLISKGFTLGLHTLAPTVEDFYSALRAEISEFERLFEAAPDVFSVHGPPCPPLRPENWEEVRAHFLKKIGPRLASFGFKGSHNISGVYSWLEDSGVGGEFSYLCETWLRPKLKNNEVHGVLTHPCHWTEWPQRWEFEDDKIKEHAALVPFISQARAWKP